MTQKYRCAENARHTATGRKARIVAVRTTALGFVYEVQVGGTTLVVHEDDLEPY